MCLGVVSYENVCNIKFCTSQAVIQNTLGKITHGCIVSVLTVKAKNV